MTSEAQRRAVRLAAFRARERDRKSIENAVAQARRDGAEDALDASRSALSEEIDGVRAEVGRALPRETLALITACVESAGADVGRKKAALDVAQKALDETRRRLLEAHRKVRQMEELAAMKRKAEEREERLREQRELDDLAVVSEVHR